MRVLTWNLWWRFGDAWRDRELGITATLQRVSPDVVGLVETWAGEGTTQAKLLADRLGGFHSAFAPTCLPPAPEEGPHAGIDIGLGLISRWPILGTEVHDLPHPRRPGPAPTALVATLDHPRGPLHVVVTCLEWEPGYAEDQLAQSRAVAELATATGLDGDLPVLVVGDLNASVDHPDLAPLLAVLTDTWAAGGGDPAAVTLSSDVPEAPREAAKQIDRRIDHVLARPGRPGRPLVVERAFLAGDRPIEGRYPSDHFAVVVDLDVTA